MSMQRYYFSFTLSVLSLCFLSVSVQAQIQAITAITTGVSGGSGVTSATDTGVGSPFYTTANYTSNFSGSTLPLATITTATATYSTLATGGNATIKARRSTQTGAPQFNIWYHRTNAGSDVGGVISLDGSLSTSVSTTFSTNNLYVGADNLFSNFDTATPTGSGNFSNVERMDVIFPGGITVRSAIGFNIFDRHATGVNHDDFRIAAITSLGTVNGDTQSPTNFGTILRGTSTDYGADVANANYTILRDTPGVGTANDHPSLNSDQQLGGAFIPSTLLASSGATIYGFSLFGEDVTGAGAALADWLNTTNYPQNSTSAGANNLDPAATISVLMTSDGKSAVIPEPNTLMLLMLGTLGSVLYRRTRS